MLLAEGIPSALTKKPLCHRNFSKHRKIRRPINSLWDDYGTTSAARWVVIRFGWRPAENNAWAGAPPTHNQPLKRWLDRGRSNRLPTADEAKPIRDIIASWNARHKVVASSEEKSGPMPLNRIIEFRPN
jgi:hypothetical protein